MSRMKTVRIEWQFFTTDVDTDEVPKDLHDEGESLMDALLAIEAANPAVSNSAISTDLTDGVVTFDVTAEGATEHEAVAAAVSAIRAAIHAVEGHTPDFPTAREVLERIAFRPGHLETEPV